MGQQKPEGQVAEEYCRNNTTLKDLTLAKKLYHENKPLYDSIEDARDYVRRYRGKKGKKNRDTLKRQDSYQEPTFDSTPPKLPESRTQSANIFHLPTSIKKVLFLTDIHVPYHTPEAIEAAVEDGIKEGVDCVWVNGDALDFYQLSFHERDPRKVNFKQEISDGRQLFAYLRGKFPTANIYYIPGNHERRLERYLMSRAVELLELDEFRLDILLHLREQDIIFIPYGSKVYFGKLLVEHGDKMKGTGGVSPARTMALKFKRHVITGHWHRKDEYNSKVYDGESTVAYTVACLCDLEPGFLPVNEHCHGFAIIEMIGGGNFIVHNKKISGGKVY